MMILKENEENAYFLNENLEEIFPNNSNKIEISENSIIGINGKVYSLVKINNKTYYGSFYEKISTNTSKNFSYFIQDLQIIKELKHPNILNYNGLLLNKKINDLKFGILFGELNENKFISIKDLKGSISNDFKIKIANQLIEAINFIQRINPDFIGDLNPNLIFINFDKKILKILPVFSHKSRKIVNISQYCSPEIYLNLDNLSKKMDVWSFGIIMLIVYYGRMPIEIPWFDISTFQEKLASIIKEIDKNTKSFIKYLDDSDIFLSNIDECLKMDPEERPDFDKLKF